MNSGSVLKKLWQLCRLLINWGPMTKEEALNRAIDATLPWIEAELLELACLLEEFQIQEGPLTKSENYHLKSMEKYSGGATQAELLDTAFQWFSEAIKAGPLNELAVSQISSGRKCLHLALLKYRLNIYGVQT